MDIFALSFKEDGGGGAFNFEEGVLSGFRLSRGAGRSSLLLFGLKGVASESSSASCTFSSSSNSPSLLLRSVPQPDSGVVVSTDFLLDFSSLLVISLTFILSCVTEELAVVLVSPLESKNFRFRFLLSEPLTFSFLQLSTVMAVLTGRSPSPRCPISLRMAREPWL